mmetsp:Transcript_43587/g.72587  ORF Transcript_43587/g.72587 Transcript_43587/m.72587 type:complete len:132 (+) Transcript_43587:102-497(+)
MRYRFPNIPITGTAGTRGHINLASTGTWSIRQILYSVTRAEIPDNMLADMRKTMGQELFGAVALKTSSEKYSPRQSLDTCSCPGFWYRRIKTPEQTMLNANKVPMLTASDSTSISTSPASSAQQNPVINVP